MYRPAPREAWKACLQWMTPPEQDAVELAVHRFLERKRGEPITADEVLAAVLPAIEPWRHKSAAEQYPEGCGTKGMR